MSMKMYAIGIAGLSFLLSACVNLKPVEDNLKLYVLGDPKGVEVVETASSVEECFYIASPDLPSHLSNDRFMVRTLNGELIEKSDVRWAEPLEEGICRALSEYISREGRWVTGYYPWPKLEANIPQLRVRFNELAFVDDGSVRISVFWVVRNRSDVLSGGVYNTYDLSWDPESPESLVKALNAALEGLATAVIAEQ